MGYTYMSYKEVGNGRRMRCNGGRGFRLNSKRFSVHRLRARFIYLFKLLDRWRCSYGQALKSLKRGFGRNRRSGSSINIKRSNNSSTSTRCLVTKVPNMVQADHCRLRSFGRSNSFYAEAIADCLEFIKRSSLSVDQNRVIQR